MFFLSSKIHHQFSNFWLRTSENRCLGLRRRRSGVSDDTESDSGGSSSEAVDSSTKLIHLQIRLEENLLFVQIWTVVNLSVSRCLWPSSQQNLIYSLWSRRLDEMLLEMFAAVLIFEDQVHIGDAVDCTTTWGLRKHELWWFSWESGGDFRFSICSSQTLIINSDVRLSIQCVYLSFCLFTSCSPDFINHWITLFHPHKIQNPAGCDGVRCGSDVCC